MYPVVKNPVARGGEKVIPAVDSYGPAVVHDALQFPMPLGTVVSPMLWEVEMAQW